MFEKYVRCPSCKEKVLYEATKCKHCHEIIENAGVVDVISFDDTQQSSYSTMLATILIALNLLVNKIQLKVANGSQEYLLYDLFISILELSLLGVFGSYLKYFPDKKILANIKMFYVAYSMFVISSFFDLAKITFIGVDWIEIIFLIILIVFGWKLGLRLRKVSSEYSALRNYGLYLMLNIPCFFLIFYVLSLSESDLDVLKFGYTAIESIMLYMVFNRARQDLKR